MVWFTVDISKEFGTETNIILHTSLPTTKGTSPVLAWWFTVAYRSVSLL